jgi:hypothetical protein
MDAGVALTIGCRRKKLLLESRTRYLSQGIIENRPFGSASKNDILLPVIKNFCESAEREPQQPKKWKFDETL